MPRFTIISSWSLKAYSATSLSPPAAPPALAGRNPADTQGNSSGVAVWDAAGPRLPSLTHQRVHVSLGVVEEPSVSTHQVKSVHQVGAAQVLRGGHGLRARRGHDHEQQHRHRLEPQSRHAGGRRTDGEEGNLHSSDPENEEAEEWELSTFAAEETQLNKVLFESEGKSLMKTCGGKRTN